MVRVGQLRRSPRLTAIRSDEPRSSVPETFLGASSMRLGAVVSGAPSPRLAKLRREALRPCDASFVAVSSGSSETLFSVSSGSNSARLGKGKLLHF